MKLAMLFMHRQAAAGALAPLAECSSRWCGAIRQHTKPAYTPEEDGPLKKDVYRQPRLLHDVPDPMDGALPGERGTEDKARTAQRDQQGQPAHGSDLDVERSGRPMGDTNASSREGDKETTPEGKPATGNVTGAPEVQADA
jgi:hypothetical protein